MPGSLSPPVHVDELYDYDGVYRLTDLDRGNLEDSNGGKQIEQNTLTFAEEWTLDSTGNWPEYNRDDNGSGWDLEQSREHNEANEIEEIDGSDDDVDHDAAGNMVKIPKPDDWEDHYDLTYDAWNRLVKVVDDSTIVAEYRYDGLGRRIRKYVPDGSDWEVYEYYYSQAWQVLEVCKATGVNRGDPLSEPAVSTGIDRQFVWGLRYLDDLILRDRDVEAGGNLGKIGSGLEERPYAMQVPNWNVAALSRDQT